MKSEPDCYSIDDLQKQGVNMWEGCRNYVVRNYLRDEMVPGDLAFFYHSSCEPPGVVGTMEIVGEPYPDPTQFDPGSEYHDPKSKKEDPRWFVRDVKFLSKLPRIVTLAEIRANPALADMALLRRGQRLSIQKVTQHEWDTILAMSQT